MFSGLKTFSNAYQQLHSDFPWKVENKWLRTIQFPVDCYLRKVTLKMKWEHSSANIQYIICLLFNDGLIYNWVQSASIRASTSSHWVTFLRPIQTSVVTMENGATFSVAHAVDTLGFGTFQVCNNFKMSSGAPSFHELAIPSTDFLTAGI